MVFDFSKCFILALRVAEFSYEIFFCIILCTITRLAGVAILSGVSRLRKRRPGEAPRRAGRAARGSWARRVSGTKLIAFAVIFINSEGPNLR